MSTQSCRANKLLGYIIRDTGFIRSIDVRRSVYLTLVRPLFGYATQIWAPQSIELITRIERTQRRATKYILKLPFSCTISYMDRLKSLDLLPLTFCYEYLDMVFFSKSFMVSFLLIHQLFLKLASRGLPDLHLVVLLNL